MKVVVFKTLKKIVKMQYIDGVLRVVANVFLSRRKLKQIIEDNLEWVKNQKMLYEASLNDESHKDDRLQYIEKDYNRMPEDEGLIVKKIFAARKTIILGNVVDVARGETLKTYLDGQTLLVSDKNFGDKQQRLKAIKSYVKKVANLFVAGEVSEYGSTVSICPIKIEFKDVSQGWCNEAAAAQKVLCIDFRIAQLPQNLRNYIIVYAFACFKYNSQSNDFWNCISNVIPNYKDAKKQLENFKFLKDL